MTHPQIFEPAAFNAALDAGLVALRQHPSAPLVILNYTQRAQFERAWNPVTTACRGLIYDTRSGEVVARPFRKFFNYGEPSAPVLDITTEAMVTDKWDGSLGILYPLDGGYAIATRGSFDSEQAVHASEVWRERYAHRFTPWAGWTPLFEIVFPSNRIVVNYGEMDDLILLGAVEIATGRSVPPTHRTVNHWPGPRAEVMPYHTVADALAAPPRPNAEGLVIYLPATDERVKLKQEDYVALHRIVTGLNERTVWEHCKNGGALHDLIDGLPDEFHAWVHEVFARLQGHLWAWRLEVEATHDGIVDGLPESYTRKDFALAAVQYPRIRSALFSRLDDKDYTPWLWDQIRPETMRGPRGLAQTVDAP